MLIVAGLISTTTIQVATSAGNDYKVNQRAEIIEKIHYYSDKYNVSFQRMYNTIECETAGTLNPQIQSNVKYNFSSVKRGIVEGDRERSYGLAQIHLPDHPKISREQSEDVDFALNFMAREYSLGHDLWYCD